MISFHIPDSKKKRVLILSDVKNEVDDQFAIVHALLSESLDIRGIIPTHFSWKKPDSQQDSAQELALLLDLLGMAASIPVADGAQDTLEKAQFAPLSPGVQMILEEAGRADLRPLYIACLGPLTDLALALRQCSASAMKNIVVLWIGGLLKAEGGNEPNLRSDIKAAQEVFASGITLWQIPREVYSMIPVSFAELYTRVRPCGAVGQYLADSVIAFNNGGPNKPSEYRVLGDSPAIGLLLNQDCGRWREIKAPLIQDDMHYGNDTAMHFIRVYEEIDSRFILEDFYAKLQLLALEDCCYKQVEE